MVDLSIAMLVYQRVPNSWMVYFMANPKMHWLIIKRVSPFQETSFLAFYCLVGDSHPDFLLMKQPVIFERHGFKKKHVITKQEGYPLVI